MLLNRIIFLIGWVLSPLTWWNDAFVNLPLAYVMASAWHYFSGGGFTAALVWSYWITNLIGIAMLYMGARELFMKEFSSRRRRLVFISAIIAYTFILTAFSLKGMIRPFSWTLR